MSRVLIIDDEDKYYDLCRRFIPEHEFLAPVRNYREAARVLARGGETVDLVLLDVHFEIPGEDLVTSGAEPDAASGGARELERLRRAQGLHILHHLRRSHPDLPVIVMTSRDDLPLEADAERLRAEDYTYLLDDDYLDARSLKLQIEGILAHREQVVDDEPFYWGTTPRMLTLRRRLAILARGQLPIILMGATGTGKSLVAREYIHPRSGRRGPFVAVDLSTVPQDLMAAHLFGAIKGAYTGASSSRQGVFSHADGGTLFLDEIGNLALDLQKSLLLVLQEGRFRQVGAVSEQEVDVKLVVATNEDLSQLVRDGRFREDLYMRLNPATAIRLPGLVERRDDFEVLLERFVARVLDEPYNRDLVGQYLRQRGLEGRGDGPLVRVTVGRSVPSRPDRAAVHFLFHTSSFQVLRDFSWPGNFRQFEMLLSNLVTLTLVELVDRAEQVEPENAGRGSRSDVIPILPRTLRELMRSMEPVGESPARITASASDLTIPVSLVPQSTLNAVSSAVERQYLEHLYRRFDGDLGRIAEALLGDRGASRKVQLRMNQLGLKLRELRKDES